MSKLTTRNANRSLAGRMKRTLIVTVGGAVVLGGVAGLQLANAADAEEPQVSEAATPMRTLSPDEALEEQIANFPPAQPITNPESEWTTAQQAIDTSRLFGQSPDFVSPVKPEDRAGFPAEAVLTTYASVARVEFGGTGDPLIAPDRPVWVVVVNAPIRNDSAPVGQKLEDMTHDVYTVIYDAPTGDLIAWGSGSDAFANGLSREGSITQGR